MAQRAIDITLAGDRQLLRRLSALEKPASQKRAVRPALRASTKRLKAVVLANLSGRVVKPVTGRLLAAMRLQKIRSIGRSRTEIGTGFAMPTREELRIDADDKYFYPIAVEFGHVKGEGRSAAPAKSFLRAAVSENRRSELIQIGRAIGKGIEREAVKQR